MTITYMQWLIENEMFNPTHNTRFVYENSLLVVVGLSSPFRFDINNMIFE